MTMQRMIGQVPHLTRQMQERMAAMMAAAAGTAGRAMNFPAETLRFLRALKRNNRREWFNAHRDDYESYVRQPMTAIVERLAVDFRCVRARAGREPEGVDVSHLPRHALLRQQDAVQDARRRGVSDARAAPSTRAPASTFTSRQTRSGSAAACTCRQPPQLFAVREHIAGHLKQLRAIVESPGFRKQVGALGGEQADAACRAVSRRSIRPPST